MIRVFVKALGARVTGGGGDKYSSTELLLLVYRTYCSNRLIWISWALSFSNLNKIKKKDFVIKNKLFFSLLNHLFLSLTPPTHIITIYVNILNIIFFKCCDHTINLKKTSEINYKVCAS